MKTLTGLTGLWRFAIIGEETWAGVSRSLSAMPANFSLSPSKEPGYVTSSKKFSR
jgi:hypothetical protein